MIREYSLCVPSAAILLEAKSDNNFEFHSDITVYLGTHMGRVT